jgi:hypothetical protein
MTDGGTISRLRRCKCHFGVGFRQTRSVHDFRGPKKNLGSLKATMLELHKSLVVAEAQSGKVVKLGCITRLPG